MLEIDLESTAGGSASKGCDFWYTISLEKNVPFKSTRIVQLGRNL